MDWILLGLSAAFLLLAVFLRWSREPESKLGAAEALLAKLSQDKACAETDRRKLLKMLFLLVAQQPADKIGNCGTDESEVIAYKAVDLLQLAYGHGLARPDEPACITSLVGSLLSQNRPGLAAAVIDTYRGLIRTLGSATMAAEQLQTVGVMAIKAQHLFVAAKAVDILFAVFEKPEKTADFQAATAAIGALRVIGKFTLKRGDHEFFRELIARLRVFLSSTPQPAFATSDLVSLLSTWTQVIVNKQDEAALTMLIDCVQELAETQLITKSVISGLLADWQDLAGLASLNPNSQIAAVLIHDMVILGVKTGDPGIWADLVKGITKIVRLIIEQYGIADAFPLLYPLLDEGRRILSAQLRFKVESSVSDFRQSALLVVIKECLSVAEFAAHARITGTTYTVLLEFFNFWQTDQKLNYKIKSAKKFFQLIILYWQKNMGRQALKQLPPDPDLLLPVLLTATDLETLHFMTE